MQKNILKGKTAVITGCNRGIGKSILTKFSEQGANSIACVREKNKEFQDFCKSLEENYKIKINIICFDLSKKNELTEGIKKILEENKKIDILVNNAGILFNSIFQMTSEKNLQKYLMLIFFTYFINSKNFKRNDEK